MVRMTDEQRESIVAEIATMLKAKTLVVLGLHEGGFAQDAARMSGDVDAQLATIERVLAAAFGPQDAADAVDRAALRAGRLGHEERMLARRDEMAERAMTARAVE